MEAGKTMGQVAREVGISVSYLSDVELDNRRPFGTDKIVAVARAIGADTKDLMQHALMARGSFLLESSGPKAVEVGAALARSWSELSDEDLEQIRNIVTKGQQK